MNDTKTYGNLFSGRTDLVWLAGNASGLGATFVAAYLMPSHGLFWAHATVASRLLLYGWSARAQWGIVFREIFPLGLKAVRVARDVIVLSYRASIKGVYNNKSSQSDVAEWLPALGRSATAFSDRPCPLATTANSHLGRSYVLP